LKASEFRGVPAQDRPTSVADETPVASRTPIARVNGAPFIDLPEDLYIPPDALEVFLDAFEGPLDLLLYLIKRQNLDILDIPIAAITRQYIGYIGMMNELRLELAADYLVMAAFLAEIKSRLLLPKSEGAEAEEEDPRIELINRLRTYERFKTAAENLDALPRCERDTFETCVDTSAIRVPKPYPEVDLKAILIAFQDVLRRAEQMGHHHVQREPLSVHERMSSLLNRLQCAGSLAFHELFRQREGKQGAVVSLLAILELCKERMIEVVQSEPLATLQITLSERLPDQARGL
jgi:segregation and condensation protein A